MRIGVAEGEGDMLPICNVVVDDEVRVTGRGGKEDANAGTKRCWERKNDAKRRGWNGIVNED